MRATGELAERVPPRDAWVEVVGTAGALEDGDDGSVTAGLRVEELRQVPEPANPYE